MYSFRFMSSNVVRVLDKTRPDLSCALASTLVLGSDLPANVLSEFQAEPVWDFCLRLPTHARLTIMQSSLREAGELVSS